MPSIPSLLMQTILQVWITFTHNWPFLLVSVIIAAGLKLLIDPNKVSAFLMRYRKAGVLGATAVAVATPLCSCGTTAILLGMMASMIPWAPIIAFMVSSPLTSPEGLIYSAGLFGWPFAVAFFIASIVLGLAGGGLGDFLERRGWLVNQSRFRAPADTGAAARPVTAAAARPLVLELAPACACACESAPAAQFAPRPSRINRPQPIRAAALMAAGASAAGSAPVQTLAAPCGCGAAQPEPEPCAFDRGQLASAQPAVTLRLFLAEVFSTGKRLLLMFVGFAFLGYFLNGLIPSAWVASFFGAGNIYSVPLAATLGLPLYINSEASLPLVRALIDSGMSQGAAMAFLITGAGTSVGALTGALTIARWRVIATVVGTLWVGAIGMGYAYNFLLASGLF